MDSKKLNILLLLQETVNNFNGKNVTKSDHNNKYDEITKKITPIIDNIHSPNERILCCLICIVSRYSVLR